MLEKIGFVGVVLLSIAGYPQLVKTVKDGHSRGIAVGFIILLSLGAIFNFIYVAFGLQNWILTVGSIIGMPPGLVILWYKIVPRKM